MARLEYDFGDGDSTSLELDSDATLIGRTTECALRVTDSTVTRRHARITRDADGYRISDLGSDNGTYVNGEWTKERLLTAGDEIQCGRLRLRFVP